MREELCEVEVVVLQHLFSRKLKLHRRLPILERKLFLLWLNQILDLSININKSLVLIFAHCLQLIQGVLDEAVFSYDFIFLIGLVIDGHCEEENIDVTIYDVSHRLEAEIDINTLL